MIFLNLFLSTCWLVSVKTSFRKFQVIWNLSRQTYTQNNVLLWFFKFMLTFGEILESQYNCLNLAQENLQKTGKQQNQLSITKTKFLTLCNLPFTCSIRDCIKTMFHSTSRLMQSWQLQQFVYLCLISKRDVSIS